MPRIAANAVEISAGSVIAREQRSPMHMKIAFGADLIFACAGCDAGKSFASATRSTTLSTNGNFNAVRTIAQSPFPSPRFRHRSSEDPVH